MWQDKSLKLFGIYVIIRVKLQKCKLCHLLVWFGLVFITSAALHFYFPRGKVRTPQNSPLHINDWSSEGCQRKISEESTCLFVSSEDFGINSLCAVQNLDITPMFGCATRFHILVLDWSKDKRLGQMSMISVQNPSFQFFAVWEAIIQKKYKSGSPLCTFLVQDVCNKNELF